MTRIANHSPPVGNASLMWAEPPPRWLIFIVAVLGVLADVTQLASLVPGV